MTGPTVLLDTSALLALLFEEPAAGAVEARLPGAAVSRMSLVEAVMFLTEQLHLAEPKAEAALRLGLEVLEVGADDAEVARGLLKRNPKLTLFERMSVASAVTHKVPVVVTVDPAWASVRVPGCRVEVLPNRPAKRARQARHG